MEQAHSHKICYNCGSEMLLKNIVLTFCVHEKRIEIPDINAYVCPSCGEILYSLQEAEKIETFVCSNLNGTTL